MKQTIFNQTKKRKHDFWPTPPKVIEYINTLVKPFYDAGFKNKTFI